MGRRYFLTGWMVFALILAGCTEDEPTIPDTPDTPLAEETIGSEGGEVAADEVVLSVPAGALTADHTLTLSESDSDHPYEQGGAFIFELEGLPEDLDVPITLKVYAGGSGKESTTALFLGETRESASHGRELTWYEVACQDSAGWCVATLDRGPYDLGEKAVPTFQVTSVDGLEKVTSSEGHFVISYPAEEVGHALAVSLAEKFETAYDAVHTLGFDFGGEHGIWPRPVEVIQLLDIADQFGRYTIAPYGKGVFAVDPLVFSHPDGPGVVAYHEVFHMAQDFYDYRPPSEWKTVNQNRRWLDEACSSWFEEEAQSDPEYCPIGLEPNNYLVPLWYGIWGPRHIDPGIYGYGMSTIIKYVTDLQGDDRVLDLYKAYPDSADVMPCFQKACDPPPEEWMTDYHHQVVLQDIYICDHGNVLMEDTQVPEVTMTGDQTSYTTHGSIRPFAAGFIRLTLTPDQPDGFASLKVAVDEDHNLAVFGLQSGQTATMLGHGGNSLTIDGLPNLLQTHEKFFLLASRPNRTPGDTSFDLAPVHWSIDLIEGQDLSRFETAIVKCKYRATWNDGVVPEQTINFSAQTGSFTGGQFYAPWDYMDGDTRKVGHITITIDPESLDIISWSASQRWEWAADWYNLYEISGTGMILEDLDDNEMEYQVDDAATCGVVNHIYVKKMVDGEVTKELLGHSCDDNSYV